MFDARYGTIIDRRPTGGGPSGRLGLYVIEDEEDGRHYTCDYTDIVTDGFRTVRTGERVRFHVPHAGSWQAQFVIRLNQPDAEDYYA
jgi:hypothetical protein